MLLQPLVEGLREGEGEVVALRVALAQPEGERLAEGQREEVGEPLGELLTLRLRVPVPETQVLALMLGL